MMITLKVVNWMRIIGATGFERVMGQSEPLLLAVMSKEKQLFNHMNGLDLVSRVDFLKGKKDVFSEKVTLVDA